MTAAAGIAGGGKATDPDLVYRRAQYWVQKNVPYNMEGSAEAISIPLGPYRTDCSGFISMAWGLGLSSNTGGLPGFSTQISKEQLRRGDILDYRSASGPGAHSHVVMFVAWANAAHTQYVEDEEAGSLGAVQRTVPYPYDSQMDGSGSWVPFRYNKINGGGSASVLAGADYHVFGISPGGSLFQRTWSGSWGVWQDLGGTVKGTPAVVYHNGQFDVFALNTAGAVVQKTYADHSWSNWKTVGGILSGGLSVVYDEHWNYHLFGITPAGTLVQRTWTVTTKSWGDWQALGSGAKGTPSATYLNGQFDVFALNTAGAVVQMTYLPGHSWSNWKTVGGILAGGIGATHQTGAYHVFGITPAGSLMQRTWTTAAHWGNWQNLGHTVTGTPSVVYHTNQYDVFAISPDGPMYQQTFKDRSWSGWKPLGGIFNG